MKLIGSGLFIIIGIIAAIIITRSFGKRSAGYTVNIIVGIAAAFAGLWLKDIFDIQLLGNLSGAAVFSTLGAFIALILLNFIYKASSSR